MVHALHARLVARLIGTQLFSSDRSRWVITASRMPVELSIGKYHGVVEENAKRNGVLQAKVFEIFLMPRFVVMRISK